ncbi:MAG: carboxymuconolactone decarboxylase family protein [Ignavibacteria bacterium]
MTKQQILILKITIFMSCNDKDNARILMQDALKLHVPYTALYEALLQIHLFSGYPASIEGLSLLQEVYNEEPAAIEEYNVQLFKQRGEKLCRDIYTTVFEKMNKRMHSFSPELSEWMIIDGYGKTLSRANLDIQIRELINICILSLGKWKQQVISHIRGALHVGVEIHDIEEAIECLQAEQTNEAYAFAKEMLKEFRS